MITTGIGGGSGEGEGEEGDGLQQIRNSIVELREMTEHVRSLVDEKVNQPIIHTWMEAK